MFCISPFSFLTPQTNSRTHTGLLDALIFSSWTPVAPPGECSRNNERIFFKDIRHKALRPTEKHVLRLPIFHFSYTPQINDHYNPIPDPHPIVPFPFSSLSRFLPELDLWTDLACIIVWLFYILVYNAGLLKTAPERHQRNFALVE